MMQRHKVRRNINSLPPLQPDFSKPIPKVKTNPFPERSETEAQLRAEVRKLNSLINAERKKFSVALGIFAAQTKRDAVRIEELMSAFFLNLKPTVSRKGED